MKKVGILGGSFSPIHNGHLQIAQDCLDKFGLEKVIFLPNAKPPHKSVEYFSYEDRANMVKLAISKNENFDISYVESDDTKVHYSFNTISENFYHESEQIFFIVGDDEFLNIKSWYRYEDFLKICTLVVFIRNFNIEYILNENKDLIEKYDIRFVENEKISISSTDIRNRLKNKLSIRYLVNEEVYKYICDTLGYFDIDKIKKDLKKKLKKDRYEHSLRVADYCSYLAKRYGVDENKAYISGLLHDCAKNLEDFYLLNNKISFGIIFDDDEIKNKSLQHSLIGAIVSKKIYGIYDEEILSAIRYHTTAKENMSMLEKILFISDKIEIGRNYPEVQDLRIMADTDINLSIIKFLDSNFEYLNKKGLKVHSLSLKAKKFLESER